MFIQIVAYIVNYCNNITDFIKNKAAIKKNDNRMVIFVMKIFHYGSM